MSVIKRTGAGLWRGQRGSGSAGLRVSGAPGQRGSGSAGSGSAGSGSAGFRVSGFRGLRLGEVLIGRVGGGWVVD